MKPKTILPPIRVLLAVAALVTAQSAAATGPPRIHETKDAVYVDIDVPGAIHTYALGISPNGKIVGVYSTEAELNPPCAYINRKGFLLEGRNFTDIVYPGTPGRINLTCAMKVNAEGVIAGWWTNATQPAAVEAGWIWDKGRFTAIHYDGEFPREAGLPVPSHVTDVVAINSSGDMTGQLYYLKGKGWDNVFHGWVYDKGRRLFQFFDPPGSVLTFPSDINDRGEIVGGYLREVDGPAVGFLRSKDGSFRDIAVPPGWDAKSQDATGINSQGVIIGEYYVDFLPNGYMLNKREFTRIDPPGSIGSSPYGINAAGVIVGAYADDKFVVHGYVRIPKP